MRSKRRRPVFFTAMSMYDGTVLGAFPIRRPTKKAMRERGHRMDADNVCQEYMGSYVGAVLKSDERIRDSDLMANRLNVRRAIRELVLPPLADLRRDIASLRTQVEALANALKSDKR